MADKRFNSYGEKRAKGSTVMMYGPGCCGHDININDPRIIERQRRRCAERDKNKPKRSEAEMLLEDEFDEN